MHNRNIDRTLDRLGAYVDPSTSTALLKYLVREEVRLGAGREQLKHIERRVRDGEERISRILAVLERLIDHGLMDQEKFSMAVAVLTTMRHSQALLGQHYRRISDGKRLLWG